MTRTKTTVYLDPDLVRAMKILAATSGRHDYEVLEEALRRYLSDAQTEPERQTLRALLDRWDANAEPSDAEALDLAYAELHDARRARHRTK
ncbi:MAG: CopG family transcriptional regulator [Dehalococcoidia bacterium]